MTQAAGDIKRQLGALCGQRRLYALSKSCEDGGVGGSNEMLIQARRCQEFVIGAQLLLGLWSNEKAGGRSELYTCVCLFLSRASRNNLFWALV